MVRDPSGSSQGRGEVICEGSTASSVQSPDSMWGFPQMGVPQNGWFIRENTIKIY